jgi:glycopeptide antibiotics resistance protein
VLATFSLSLTYETIHLLTGFGSFDVDDLILLGGMVGFILFKILQFFMETKNSKRRGLHT